MLFDWSQEGDAKGTNGLGLIPGKVVRFDLEGQLQDDGSRFKVPQMGWNRVRQTQRHALWDGVPDESFFYFVHSYYGVPDNPAHTSGETLYGAPFYFGYRSGQSVRDPVSPREERRCGLAAVSKLRTLETMKFAFLVLF